MGDGGVFSNLGNFYRRRIFRLLPALTVTLVISGILIYLLGPVDDHGRFSRQGIATLFLVGNVGAHKFSGDYFSPNPNPLVHTWSLSVEEQIYIFLPLIFFVILRKGTGREHKVLFFFVLISLMSLMFFLFPTTLQPLYTGLGIDSASDFSFYSPIERIWQFTIGSVAFCLHNRTQDRAVKIPKLVHWIITASVIVILLSSIDISQKISSLFASLVAVTVI